MSSVIKYIEHYQKSIEDANDNEERLLHCLQKLQGLQVKVSHLQTTGIGRTVNGLRKQPGKVRDAAKQLVTKWKQIVNEHESSDEDDQSVTCPVNGASLTNSSLDMSPSRDSDEKRQHRDRHQENSSHRSSSSSKKSKGEHRSRESKNNHEKRRKSSDGSDSDEIHDSKKSYDSHKSSSNDHKHKLESHKNSSEGHKNSLNSHKSNSSSHKSSDSHRNSDSKNSSDHRKSSENHRNSDKHKTDSKHRDHVKSSRDKSSESKNNYKNGIEKEYSTSKKHSSENGHHSSSRDKITGNHSRSEKSSKKDKSDKVLSFEDAMTAKINKKSEVKKPKIKKEIESDEEAGGSFEDALGSLDLPVPKFSKMKVKSEPLDEYVPSTNYSSSKSRDDRKKIKSEPVDEYVPTSKSSSKDRDRKKIKSEPVEEYEPSNYVPERSGSESPVGASFEEALGFVDTSPSKSKVKKDKKKRSHATSSSDYVRPLPKSEEINALLQLPAINPNYRPLPQVPVRQHKYSGFENDALTSMMHAKTQRTKVYSGVKTIQGEIPSLQDMCIKILQENIDDIEYIGYAPYYLMEPVFTRCSAGQLANIERHNPRLTEDTDDLWQTLVKSEFRGAQLENGECWRDVYERSLGERENKLGSLMARIRENNLTRMAPQRKTKLAYVNTQVKPPRNIIKQQMRHGTSRGSLPAPRPKSVVSYDDQPGTSGQQPQAGTSHASTIARTVGILREGPSMSIKSRKRPAPLMQKTLKFMKTSFRR